jgi:DNA-binding transcriptional LysR family regulator
MLGLDDMGIFLSIVETGSFTTAAKRLGLRKSTVSRRLSALEERLGIKLLHRTTRQLRLTDAGERYHARCVKVVAEARAAEDELREEHDEPRGTLRMSATPPLADLLLPLVLYPYMARYPQVKVEVVTSWNLVDMVAQGFDLALRVGPLADSSLNARALGSARVAYCASPAYVRAHGVPRSPRELDQHTCVVISEGQERVHWPFLGPQGRVVRVPVEARLRVNQFSLAYRAVLEGLGLGRFPQPLAAEDLEAGRLVEVLTEHLPPSFPVFALYPGSRRASPRVHAFLQMLNAYMRAHPEVVNDWSVPEPDARAGPVRPPT